jgi:hypothetical protein
MRRTDAIHDKIGGTGWRVRPAYNKRRLSVNWLVGLPNGEAGERSMHDRAASLYAEKTTTSHFESLSIVFCMKRQAPGREMNCSESSSPRINKHFGNWCTSEYPWLCLAVDFQFKRTSGREAQGFQKILPTTHNSASGGFVPVLPLLS